MNHLSCPSGVEARLYPRDRVIRLGQLAKEGENLPRHVRPCAALALPVDCARVVAAVEGDPGDRVAGVAARILGPDVTPAPDGGLLRIDPGAAIVGYELVPHRAAASDPKNVVGDAVDANVSNGVAAARAAAEDTARDDGDAAEDVGARAGDGVAHGAAPREAYGIALPLVDAKPSLDVGNHGVDKGDILATRVGPAAVEPVGSDENGALLADALHSVVCPGLPIGATAGDVVHAAAAPVEAEDKLIRPITVVTIGHADDVLSVLAVHVDGPCS